MSRSHRANVSLEIIHEIIKYYPTIHYLELHIYVIETNKFPFMGSTFLSCNIQKSFPTNLNKKHLEE